MKFNWLFRGLQCHCGGRGDLLSGNGMAARHGCDAKDNGNYGTVRLLRCHLILYLISELVVTSLFSGAAWTTCKTL